MIRTKLTISICAVLSLVLGLIGFAIYITTRQQIYAGVDQNLRERADFFAMAQSYRPVPPPGAISVSESGFGTSAGGFRVSGPPLGSPTIARIRGTVDEVRTLRGSGIDPKTFRQVQTANAVLSPLIVSVNAKGATEFGGDQVWDPKGYAAAQRGIPTFGTAEQDGDAIRVLSIPLRDHGKITSVGQLAEPLGEKQAMLARLATTLGLVLPLAVVVMMVTGVVVTRGALHPISKITRAADAIGAGNISRRLPVEGRDEFAEMSGTFNSMLDRLEAAFLEKDEAYARQRRFTADASHELKTPLTAIRARTGLALRRDLSADEYRRHLYAIDRASGLMSEIVKDLLLLAASDEGRLSLNPEPVGVSALVEDAVASVDTNGLAVRVEVAEDVTARVDAAAITRVLVNLVENAVRHTDTGGSIQVTAGKVAGDVKISVADDGCGIPEQHVPLVFNRFHRVDKSRGRHSGGSGLGLAIAKAIVEAHHGKISLSSRVGLGTTVNVVLPA